MTVALGFVVAGGRSHRMGRDKALLPWGTGTLLDHALLRLGAVCSEVRILSGPEPRYLDHGVPVDADVMADAGATGGLLTGLARLTGGPGLFLAVDLPFVTLPLLRHLLALAVEADAVVPVSRGGPEPLCAAYGRACLEPVRRCVVGGDLKLTAFWPGARVREVREDELAAFGDPDELFRNLNTPDEYERARATSS